MKVPILSLFTLIFISLHFAVARDKAGNGGGAHVCRDPETGKIRTIELYDLYEGRVRYGFRPVDLRGVSSSVVFAGAISRLKAEHESLAVRAEAMRLAVEKYWSPGAQRLIPSIDSDRVMVDPGCAYEQIATWDEQVGKIFVDEELVNALDPVSLGALFLHESIYKIARVYSGEVDSNETRELVARIFSGERVETEIDGRYHGQLQDVGAVFFSEGWDLLYPNRFDRKGERELTLRLNWTRPGCYDYAKWLDEERRRNGDLIPAEPSKDGFALDQPIRLSVEGPAVLTYSAGILDFENPAELVAQTLRISRKESFWRSHVSHSPDSVVKFEMTNPICGEVLDSYLSFPSGKKGTSIRVIQ